MKIKINEAPETNFTEKQMNYAAGQNYVIAMKAFDAFKSAGFDPKFQWGRMNEKSIHNDNGTYYIDPIEIQIVIASMLFNFKCAIFDSWSQRFEIKTEWGFGGYRNTSSVVKVEDAEKLLAATKLAYKLFDEIRPQFDKIIKTIESGNI